MENFTKKSMEVYAELVRIVGGQESWISGNTFYWYLVFEDCSDFGTELRFFIKDNNPVIEIDDAMIESIFTYTINQDVIHCIIGYACNNGIELKNNDYLHINGNNNNNDSLK